MAVLDVFNGDADGICALIQLRKAMPIDSELITGVKRDIKLMGRVKAGSGDQVNVLDISLDKNRDELMRVLSAGAKVFYCDHHVPGEIPDHDGLETLINTAPDICTSLLINSKLKGAFSRWAIVGAFGDNLNKSAESLAGSMGLEREQLAQLRNLGVYINYNGYGASLDDLHFSPEQLYRRLSPFSDPLDFIEQDEETFLKLERGYCADMDSARAAPMLMEADTAAALLLPNEKWARRVSGVYGNALANENPDRAHAVLTERNDDTYLVSVRAPLTNKNFADKLCMEFPTGGGRKAAAGINALPAELLDKFLDRIQEIYSAE